MAAARPTPPGWSVGWFTAERQVEWAEFLAGCNRFDAEIDKEIGQRQFTLAD